jgi:hypothetical protein
MATGASGPEGPFRTVENRDVFVGAYRDVFTAFLKGPSGHDAQYRVGLLAIGLRRT